MMKVRLIIVKRKKVNKKLDKPREIQLKNRRKKIETMNNQIEKIAIKQQEILSNQIGIYKTHLNKSYKYYINNQPTPSLYNPLGKYTAQ